MAEYRQIKFQTNVPMRVKFPFEGGFMKSMGKATPSRWKPSGQIRKPDPSPSPVTRRSKALYDALLS